ncbi:MAG: hypothetical protein QQN53_08080 [Nitrosopumilus sp.]
MNTFLGMGIFLFVATILFAVVYLSSLPDVITEEIKNVADNISYANSALWIMSIILSSIGMKKRRDSKREDNLSKQKSEKNLTRIDNIITDLEQETKKLKEKVEGLEKDKEKKE